MRTVPTISSAFQLSPGPFSIDKELTKNSLALCMRMAEDEPVSVSSFSAIFYACNHFNGRNLIEEFSERLGQITQKELEKSVRSLKAECGKGGNIIAAKALVLLLNKGKRNKKLTW